MRACASVQAGSSGPGCAQCTSDASSHQFSSLRMAGPCGEASMNARIAVSDSQLVLVQKVRRMS